MKSIITLIKWPQRISLSPTVNDIDSRLFVFERIIPSIGLTISVTRDETTFVTAPPKMKPTANPTTPLSLMNSINPFIFFNRLRLGIPDNFPWPNLYIPDYIRFFQ